MQLRAQSLLITKSYALYYELVKKNRIFAALSGHKTQDISHYQWRVLCIFFEMLEGDDLRDARALGGKSGVSRNAYDMSARRDLKQVCALVSPEVAATIRSKQQHSFSFIRYVILPISRHLDVVFHVYNGVL